MKDIIISSVPVITLNSLPDTCAGISFYKGVFVLWDEDFDTRIITAIDLMPASERDKLFSVHERKGMVALHWRLPPSDRYSDGRLFLDDMCVGTDFDITNHVMSL